MADSLPTPWAERRPKKQTISIEEFRDQLGRQGEELARLANGLLATSPEAWTQRHLVHLYRSATEVESFLDAHGARRNEAFFRSREVLAIVRWLSAGLSSLVHLYGRLPSYEVANEAWVEETLAPQVRDAALRQGEILQRALQGLQAEWLRAKVAWPEGELQVEQLAPLAGLVQLPNDRLAQIDAADPQAGGAQGARTASRFLSLSKAWTSEATSPIEGLDALRTFMENFCTEEIARRYEARVHNLQSSYDTRVSGTQEESDHPDLKVLRGTASLVLHLLENVTALTHLYERHDIYERAGESRALFDELVPEEALLQVIVNDGVVAAYACLRQAEPIARALLDQLVETVEVPVSVPDGVTMHARPLSLIVGVVQKYGTPVELEVAGQTCSAASMMQMLVLVGSYPQERDYLLRGDPRPLDDLKLLFANRLGEDGCDGFPEQIAYLRP